MTPPPPVVPEYDCSINLGQPRKVIHLIAGARPNFIKVAPLYHQLVKTDWCRPSIIHTGQHTDPMMSETFFQALQLPTPEFNLGQTKTGAILDAYEELCKRHRPDAVIVPGDVNGSVACALAAARQNIPVVHLEAGLRSNDRSMVEEVNRIAIDGVAELFWTTEPSADQNLVAEGVHDQRIVRTGNFMVDAYELVKSEVKTYATDHEYFVATIHRPGNLVQERLVPIVASLCKLAEEVAVVFPCHPRTRQYLEAYELWPLINENKALRVIEPLGYIQMMGLVRGAKMVITDSGGLQEETTYLGVPCATVRPNTERPITLQQGTNMLIEPQFIVAAGRAALRGRWQKPKQIFYWDGRAAKRAETSLRYYLNAVDPGVRKAH